MRDGDGRVSGRFRSPIQMVLRLLHYDYSGTLWTGSDELPISHTTVGKRVPAIANHGSPDLSRSNPGTPGLSFRVPLRSGTINVASGDMEYLS